MGVRSNIYDYDIGKFFTNLLFTALFVFNNNHLNVS